MECFVVSLVGERIKSRIKKHISRNAHSSLWLQEAKELRSEVKRLESILEKTHEKKQVKYKEKVHPLLEEIKTSAYELEDDFDTYISKMEASRFHRFTWFTRRNHIKGLRNLRKKVYDLNGLLHDNFNVGNGDAPSSEKEKQGNVANSENNVDENNKEDIIKESENNSSMVQPNSFPSEQGGNTAHSNEDARAAEALGRSHSQVYDKFVVGIEKDVQRLVDKLTVDDEKVTVDDEKVDVLAIVGMGGSGKTTLAENIYNHQKVQKHFKYRAWVSLSRGWDQPELVSEKIIKQLFSNIVISPESKSEAVLLKNLLRLKTCLIVLDDVWDWESLQDLLSKLVQPSHIKDEDDSHHESSSIWTLFKNNQDYPKTKIVITSRHLFDTSNISLRCHFHEMRLLDEEEGWALFKNVSSSENGKELASEYRGLAMEMLRRCEGLPLAIVGLGKLLKTKNTILGWERVYFELVSKKSPNDLYLPVKDILALSYQDLQYYLKPCFLYFGLFPDDFPIKAATLVRMWIAEGFVQRQCRDGESSESAETSAETSSEGFVQRNYRDGKGAEDAAETSSEDAETMNLEFEARMLMQKLIDHTMVQVVKRTYNGKVKTLRILSMMRDLCIIKSHEIDFLTVSSSESDHITQRKSRRAAINLSYSSSTLALENPYLRTLFLHQHDGGVGGHADIKGVQFEGRLRNLNQQTILDLASMFEKLKFLRVLDINGIKTSDGVMPEEIGNLIHLRYLRVRSTNIRELPKSIGKLRELLTLDYWNVYVYNEAIKLPNVFSKLRNLRHLYLPYERSNITKMNFKLDSIKDLQTLWGVRGGDWMIDEMANISPKLKKLCIQGISSLEQIDSVFKSRAIDNLYSLALDWYGFELKNHEALLSKKSNLKKLRLLGMAPDELKPLAFPRNLTKLELYYTRLQKPESMAALGELQCLKFLRLATDSFVGSEWIVEDDKSFPQLEVLKLSDLTKLNKWELTSGTMPRLKKFTIVSCNHLIQIPQKLSSSTTLKLKVERMPSNFKTSLGKLDPNANSATEKSFNITQRIAYISRRDAYALRNTIMHVLCILLLYSVYKLAIY